MEMTEQDKSRLKDIQRRHSLDPEDISREERGFREVYIETMLEEINASLCVTTEDDRSWFILFYGLNGEHGIWSYYRIADWYGVTPSEVIRSIRETEKILPSDEHKTFVKSYRELYFS